MGFSFRKLFRIGKTNVSLSRRGIGVSTKIAGVRIGATPNRRAKISIRKGIFSWSKTMGAKKRRK